MTGTTIDVTRRTRRRRVTLFAVATVLAAAGAAGIVLVLDDDPAAVRTTSASSDPELQPATGAPDDSSGPAGSIDGRSGTDDNAADTVVVRAPTVRSAVLPAEPVDDEGPGSTVTTTPAPPDTTVPDDVPADLPDDVPDTPTESTADAGAPAPTAPIAPPTDPEAAEPLVQVGTILIPKLGLDHAMYSGIRLSTLDQGPGHWPGTALPGEVGNVVVAGHRTSHGAPFRHLDTLAPGDEVRFATDAGTFVYRVTGTRVVEPDAVWIVDPTPTPTATLFACHPPGSVSHRVVVHLELAA